MSGPNRSADTQRSLKRSDFVRTKTLRPGQSHLSTLRNIPVRYHRTPPWSHSHGGAGNKTDHHRQTSYPFGTPISRESLNRYNTETLQLVPGGRRSPSPSLASPATDPPKPPGPGSPARASRSPNGRGPLDHAVLLSGDFVPCVIVWSWRFLAEVKPGRKWLSAGRGNRRAGSVMGRDWLAWRHGPSRRLQKR